MIGPIQNGSSAQQQKRKVKKKLNIQQKEEIAKQKVNPLPGKKLWYHYLKKQKQTADQFLLAENSRWKWPPWPFVAAPNPDRTPVSTV